MIARASSCWLYAPPALALAVGQYAVMIMVFAIFYPCGRIHDQRNRFLNYWPVPIALHDNLSTSMIAAPPLWNDPPEMVTRLYPVIFLIFLNHLSVLLYIFSFMGILLQLMFTSAIPLIDFPSFIIVFFKVSSLCWLDKSDALPIPLMFWNMILILTSLSPPLSWQPQSPRQFLLGYVSVFFGIPLWRHPGGCG